MAPKGGRGGGGGGGGGSSSGISCSSYAFASDYSRILIAFVAFWLLVGFTLAFLVGPRRKRLLAMGYPKESLQWNILSLSLGLMILNLILNIVASVLSECGSGSSATPRLNIASTWLVYSSTLFLYGVIMVPLCRQLHRAAGTIMARIATVGHSVLMVLLGIFLLAFLGVATALSEWQISGDYFSSINPFALLEAQRGLIITFEVFALIAMLIATVNICIAFARAKALRSGSMLVWIPFLIAGSVGLTTFDLAASADALFNLSEFTLSAARNLAVTFLGYFFYFLTFTSVLYVVSNSALASAHRDSAAGAPVTDPAALHQPGAVPVPVGIPVANGETKDYYATSPDQQNAQLYQQPQYQQPQQQQVPMYQQPQPGQQYATPAPPQPYYS
ncbi:predicted protein [Uncinocarpus reesii 1704]|uniref:Uncharacterized protein n=1 Tax=Uncinocarpus reesii (strain UAMH 1704) TaxID=336963 RepID=C4JXS3_UNCRE|nr:uncharacterized protein UREG_07861 [Uncinocarpus reesii 1704]EEP82996.1 predicted protein [Uncinocarpus reesii 1704]